MIPSQGVLPVHIVRKHLLGIGDGLRMARKPPLSPICRILCRDNTPHQRHTRSLPALRLTSTLIMSIYQVWGPPSLRGILNISSTLVQKRINRTAGLRRKRVRRPQIVSLHHTFPRQAIPTQDDLVPSRQRPSSPTYNYSFAICSLLCQSSIGNSSWTRSSTRIIITWHPICTASCVRYVLRLLFSLTSRYHNLHLLTRR